MKICKCFESMDDHFQPIRH